MQRHTNKPDIIDIAGVQFVVGVPAACRLLNQEIMTRCSTASKEFFQNDCEREDGPIKERTVKAWIDDKKIAVMDEATRLKLIQEGLYEERPGKPVLIDVTSLYCFPNSWCPQSPQGSSYIVCSAKEASKRFGCSERTLSDQNAEDAPHFRIGKFVGYNMASYTDWDFQRKRE